MNERINEIIEYSRKYLGEEFTSVILNGIDLAPYIGRFLQTRKLNRAVDRIKEHSVKLQRISKLISESIKEEEFINEKVGPLVFSDLVEEHEDAKIIYLLNGFENVFIEQKFEESLIYNYFDTLRNLRYHDLRRLLYFKGFSDIYPRELYFIGSEYDAFTNSIDAKLERNYLITVYRGFTFGGYDDPPEEDKIKITNYGNQFIKFIYDHKEYEFNEKYLKTQQK